MKVLVIDFGGTYTKYCVMDEHANMTRKNEKPSPLIGVDSYIQFLKDLYEEYKDEVEGIAISMPGMIDIKSGLLKGGGAFLDLYGHNLYDLIRQAVPVPFTVENDGKCGALSEVWNGSLKEVNDGVVVIIGTGIAGGIIKDRKIHRGHHDTAGEISYLMVTPGEYGIPNLICMHAAMMGLTTKAAAAKGYDKSHLESGALKRDDVNLAPDLDENAAAETKKDDNTVVDGKLIFRWLEEGDPAITAIYQSFIQHTAVMLFNLQVTYDPEKIALGGGISREPRLIPDIQAELARIVDSIAAFNPPRVDLVSCKHLGSANLVGAMYNYLSVHNPSLIH